MLAPLATPDETTNDGLRSVFDRAAVGIGRIGLDGRFLEVNARYCEIVGYSAAELAERTFQAITHPDDLEADLARARALLDGSISTYSLEKRYVRKDGTLVWVNLTGSVARDAAGRPVHFVAVVEDVTARRQAEEALRESERRKADFLAVLSHELRNPLTPIRNGLCVLDRAPPDSPEFERAKRALHRQTEHLARLVDDLLDLTRISHGKITLARARLDAAEVVRRACEDHRSLLEGRGLELAVALPDRPVWIDADETRVAQVVGNLLLNAAKFTPAGGRVEVALAEREGRCELRVRDTGDGIEPELLERIFEPFEQAQRTRPSAGGGVGLGLAVVKHVVELHGGTVRAWSDGVDRGAELTVALPVASAPAGAAPPPPAPRSRGLPGLRILVAEDNGDAGETLADLLRLQGHRVEVATDGRSALAAAQREPPDVVICDIGLPDLTGYEVIRAVRAGEDGQPAFAIALTGYAQPEDRARALAAGFDAHLAKPTPLAELEGLLAAACDARRAPERRSG